MRKLYVVFAGIVILIIGIAGYMMWQRWQASPAPERVRYEPAKISDIRSMVELQTVSVWQEIPFKATIGSRHLVGRVSVEGTIGFDLEKITLEEQGDTLHVTLPPATLTLRESTRPDAYVIYDSWNDKLLGPAVFSAAEENLAKAHVLESVRRNIEKRGESAKARKSALESVARLLSNATGRPVMCK